MYQSGSVLVFAGLSQTCVRESYLFLQACPKSCVSWEDVLVLQAFLKTCIREMCLSLQSCFKTCLKKEKKTEDFYRAPTTVSTTRLTVIMYIVKS